MQGAGWEGRGGRENSSMACGHACRRASHPGLGGACQPSFLVKQGEQNLLVEKCM